MYRILCASVLFAMGVVGFGELDRTMPTKPKAPSDQTSLDALAEQVAWTLPRNRVRTPRAVAGVRG